MLSIRGLDAHFVSRLYLLQEVDLVAAQDQCQVAHAGLAAEMPEDLLAAFLEPDGQGGVGDVAEYIHFGEAREYGDRHRVSLRSGLPPQCAACAGASHAAGHHPPATRPRYAARRSPDRRFSA